MRSIFYSNYINTIRWDSISRFSHDRFSNLPKIESIVFRLHESQPKQSKDKYIASLFLELITSQRVSPMILSKGSYKISFSTKRSRKDLQTQVTLRNSNLNYFFDRWVLLALGKNSQFNSLRNIKSDSHGGMHLYYLDIFSFFELDQLGSFIDRCNGLQMHIKTNASSHLESLFLLSSTGIPIEKEGSVIKDSLPSISFFNVNTIDRIKKSRKKLKFSRISVKNDLSINWWDSGYTNPVN